MQKGNCKPIWLLLTPAASMTALPAPFITLRFRTASTAKGIKREGWPGLPPPLCSGIKGAGGGMPPGEGFPHPPTKKGASGAVRFGGGIPCQTAVEDRASSY